MDPLASWLAQTRKGIVELFVLELLSSRGRMHGYGIVQALDELGDLVAGLSTVYPVLKRLEADGLVEADMGDRHARQPPQVLRADHGWGRVPDARSG